MAGVSVLAVDYRLVPENRRIDCLTDCQTAYRWILEHGPQGNVHRRTRCSFPATRRGET